MLTQKLLAVTNLGADWVLWLLVGLSIVSVGIMIERAFFFAGRRMVDLDAVAKQLLAGDLAGARMAVQGRVGMEADVVRAAVENAARGPDSVAEVVNGQLERARLEYER